MLNDAGLDLAHKVGKAVLCLLRDGCDCCCLHDDLDLDVCNLDDDAGLVEIMWPLDEVAHLVEFLELDLV